MSSKAPVDLHRIVARIAELALLAGILTGAAAAAIAIIGGCSPLSIESLMPALSNQALAGDADPPIAEQLITPNALRQHRYRERWKALPDRRYVTAQETHPARTQPRGRVEIMTSRARAKYEPASSEDSS